MLILDILLEDGTLSTDRIKEDLRRFGVENLNFESVKNSKETIQKFITENNLRNKSMRYEFEDVNVAWCMDFKYIILPNGKTYYLLKIIDDRSRYCIGSSLSEEATAEVALNLILKSIQKEGIKPILIKTDRGPQFKVHFTSKLEELSIVHLKSIPYYPRYNSKIERVFLDVENIVCSKIDKTFDFSAIEEMIIREELNHNHSPHESLGGLTPYQVFNKISTNIVKTTKHIFHKIKNSKCLKKIKYSIEKLITYAPWLHLDLNVIVYR